MLPRLWIALGAALAGCGGAAGASTAYPHADTTSAPMQWSGRIAEADDFPWGEPGTPCDVEITRHEETAPLDCRVRIRCGDGEGRGAARVIYGRGDSGYNACRWTGALPRAEDASASDGDPRLRMDLVAGEVEVVDDAAVEERWRVLITRTGEQHTIEVRADELRVDTSAPERRVTVEPSIAGVAVSVQERACATCVFRPVAGLAIELRGPTRSNGNVTTTASGITDDSGVAVVELPDGPDGLLWSPGPVIAHMEGAADVDVSDSFRLAVGAARRAATQRASQRAPDVGSWDGMLAGLPIAGRARREVSSACTAAGLRWERYRDSGYRCIGSDAPVPRHLLGHRGAMVVFTFDARERVESAALNLPFGSTQAAYNHAGRLALEARRAIGQSEHESGGLLSGRAIWRVRDPGGASWRMVIAIEAGTTVMGYMRSRDEPAAADATSAPADPELERLMTLAEE